MRRELFERDGLPVVKLHGLPAKHEFLTMDDVRNLAEELDNLLFEMALYKVAIRDGKLEALKKAVQEYRG